MFTDQFCINCRSTQLVQHTTSIECENCGLIFAKNRTTLDYSRVYTEDSEIYPTHFKALDYFQKSNNILKELLPFEQSILSFIKDRDNIKTVVDLGCGIGRFLRALSISNFQAYGYEISIEIVKRLTSYGLKVDRGSSNEFLNSSFKPDAITLLEVVEHLPNPGDVVTSLIEEKHPKILFVVVPAWASRRRYDSQFASHDVPPNHLSWWSSKSLILLLTRSGYKVEVLSIREARRNLFSNFLYHQRKVSPTNWLNLLYTMIKPPIFWYLGVAYRYEN